MAENNFSKNLNEGKNGEAFLAAHFQEITGVQIPAGAEAWLYTPQGYNAGEDVSLVWYTTTSGNMEIVDGVKAKMIDGEEVRESIYRMVHGDKTSRYQYVVEVKTNRGKFLSRNNIYPDNALVINATCGSLGFEAYKEGSHKPGWMFEYMEGLRLDGSGLPITQPNMIIHTLYLSGTAEGIPFACITIPMTMKTIDRLQWYISRNKSWIIEEDVAAGTVTINPPCGSTHGDGLAWQGSTRGEGHNMIHIPMTEILNHMDGKIIMVGKPLTDAELFTTAGFNDCAKYLHSKIKAEELVQKRYRFLQDHATGQIIP
ncbi:MAG: hypothetical protein IKE24_12975 [Clostridia bacterium]|nr:hypothetical protein [Clostridia bacterium]